MGNLEFYEQKLAVLNAIEDSLIAVPHHIPVDACIQEAQNLYIEASEDKDILVASGLPWDLVEDLPVRTGALIEAEARWQRQRYTNEYSWEWHRRSPLAYDLRKRLLKACRYAFQDHPDLMKAVRNISKGKRQPDIIQCLSDLAALGKANTPLLEDISFDISLLDKAAQTSKEMASLLANFNLEKHTTDPAKKIRDKAYTHLKEAVDAIRAHGQFVFRKDKDRLIVYRSSHIRKIKKAQKRKSKKNSSENPPVVNMEID